MFKKSDFTHETEDADNPFLPDNIRKRFPSYLTTCKHFNWDNPTNPKTFSICNTDGLDNDHDSYDIDVNIYNDESYESTVAEFENMTIHIKFLYLQSTRSSFVNIDVHLHLYEDSQILKKKDNVSKSSLLYS